MKVTTDEIDTSLLAKNRHKEMQNIKEWIFNDNRAYKPVIFGTSELEMSISNFSSALRESTKESITKLDEMIEALERGKHND